MTEPNEKPSPQSPMPAKIQVLLVDDHALVRQGLRMFIEMQNDMVVAGEGANGNEAVELAARLKPDVILLDLVMPDESGFQVACKINYFSGLAHIPIIAMTGYFKESYIPLMSGYGIKDYLKKPFDPLELIAKIESVI